MALPAQPTLAGLTDALERADRLGDANRGARSHADAQRANALAALRGILPSARVEAGYLRTTDPIGAFGTVLRQRRISQQDFDLARLNSPSRVGNHGAALVVDPAHHGGRAPPVLGAPPPRDEHGGRMKLVMLIHSGPHEDRLTRLLDAHDAGGYTELRDVHGTGASGRILGTRAWPGRATILLSIVPVARVDALRQALRAHKDSLVAGEHLHVAALPVEAYF